MTKQEIEVEINKYKSLLNLANTNLTELKKKLETVNEFMNKFQNELAKFEDDMSSRKRKLVNISYMANNVNCARRYYDHMESMLNSSEHNLVLRKMEFMEDDIRRKITETNSEIYTMQQEISTYERKISELTINLLNCTE